MDVPARRDATEEARRVHRARHPGATVVLLAGSVVRGEATPHSDLDLVVIYERLDHAYRESFLSDGWPVETFVHDPETLRYFFVEVDGKAGIPSLAYMTAEAIELTPPSARSHELRALALATLAAGPPPWSDAELRQRRYVLTDLVDDLRAPRSQPECVAAGARLYELLADFELRAHSRWSARGKSIPPGLAAYDATLADRFVAAFDRLFAGDATAVVALAEERLRPFGGPYFAGHRLDCPTSWR